MDPNRDLRCWNTRASIHIVALMTALTEEGASGRAPIGVDEGRGKSACALCRGSAGVADLDISHALLGGTEGGKRTKNTSNLLTSSFHSALVELGAKHVRPGAIWQKVETGVGWTGG